MENVPLVEFIYFVFIRTPGGVTVGNSGLCCYVSCVTSAMMSLFVLFSNSNEAYDVGSSLVP